MQNPFLTVWTKPQQTYKSFFNERKSKAIYGLPFIILGISFGLDTGKDVFLVIDSSPTWGTKILVYAFLIPISIVLAYVFFGQLHPWLLKLTGNIWNGKATKKQLANVNSLSCIPYCFVLLYQLVLLIIGMEPAMELVNPVFHFIITIISFRTLVIGLSLVQKFSYGIAILNFFISILPLIILRLLMI